MSNRIDTLIRPDRGNYIQTHTGLRFYPLDPQPEDICIEDIAHALSNICRFTGHTKHFYSVAQHSYYVSHQVPQEHALAALLHDASEAYISDVSKPVKELGVMGAYKQIEHLIMQAIAQKFGIQYPFHESIKEADERMLFTEKRDLLPPMDWGWTREPYKEEVIAFSPIHAEIEFLKRFYELTNTQPENPRWERDKRNAEIENIMKRIVFTDEPIKP